MVYYHNIEQGSDEWLKFREDCLTGSNATAIAANGSGLKTYCMNKAMVLNGGKKNNYTNPDMDRGTEHEPLAITAYEMEYAVNIVTTGCITNNKYPNVLISPDGLINKDGGIEVKSRNDEKHHALIMGITKDIPFNQIQMNLLVSERKWWDFVSFNPNFSKPLFLKRIYPDLDYFKKLEKGFIDGNILIKQYIEKYNNYNIK